jgi:hypothetical protein
MVHSGTLYAPTTAGLPPQRAEIGFVSDPGLEASAIYVLVSWRKCG